MKKILIAIAGIYLLNIALVFSQDIINPPVLDTVKHQTSLIYRGNLGFMKGWNWGSPGKNHDQAITETSEFFVVV